MANHRAFAFAACGALIALLATEASAQFDSKIAFLSQQAGAWDVMVMDPDGSSLVNLTDHPANDVGPAWSPDGREIAFASERDGGSNIYIMDADGANPHPITSASVVGEPDWSPDGSKIVYTDWSSGPGVITVMNSDGSNPDPLTDPGHDNGAPAWSPDGSEIAFMSWRDGIDPEIYVMDADGSNETNLTHNGGIGEWWPAWSPDSSKLSFTSDRDGNLEVYVADIANKVLSNVDRRTFDGAQSNASSWSPDGQEIAYFHHAPNQIHVVTAFGHPPVDDNRSLEGDGIYPDWSPYLTPSEIILAIDVKPGSDENPVSLRSKGVIPVAVLTTDDFDATTLDGASARLGPDGAGIAHRSAHYEDVDGDGRVDWVGHFRTQAIGLAADATDVTLTAQTLDGVPLSGSDVVSIVGKGRKAPALTLAGSRPVTWGGLRRRIAVR
ncbi:hypothetical protein HN371_17980 [Candidatus Poribacteria bacterium]|jgi:dipeptidyl aminopeptidase/acylaminoacyl peptidase|nr:hypothetical protein [Candidatus Poribacteria bacterium]MBT5710788.1 hypothetical protein [Candidatus Poribacteria bacterium]MBT7099152.1 hypothetical protein [Candidatus Poribacteria bacterium]MBT7808108.1 hypothetical protein [Candidatus Poribacteria bacterium]